MKKDQEVEAIEEQVKTCAIDSATALLEGRLDDARWSAARMQEHRQALIKHRVAQPSGRQAVTGSSEETYANRRTETFTVKTLSEGKGTVTIYTTGADGFIIPLTDGTRQIREGGTYLLELKGFNELGGFLTMDGGYLMRRSNQYFERQREQFLAEEARRKREQLEAQP